MFSYRNETQVGANAPKIKLDVGLVAKEVCSMCKVSKVLNYIVFIATTIAIAGVFYEGMALKWFDIVGIFIIFMDVSFIISTIVNLFVCRKTKWIYVNVFSILMIVIALSMKLFSVSYPIWSLVFWYFYIWFVYGIQITSNRK